MLYHKKKAGRSSLGGEKADTEESIVIGVGGTPKNGVRKPGVRRYGGTDLTTSAIMPVNDGRKRKGRSGETPLKGHCRGRKKGVRKADRSNLQDGKRLMMERNGGSWWHSGVLRRTSM